MASVCRAGHAAGIQLRRSSTCDSSRLATCSFSLESPFAGTSSKKRALSCGPALRRILHIPAQWRQIDNSFSHGQCSRLDSEKSHQARQFIPHPDCTDANQDRHSKKEWCAWQPHPVKMAKCAFWYCYHQGAQNRLGPETT
eukprot:786893-Amphidinium_carterae.1